ncbi:DNA mismatch repair endonuclease MutL [Buchnera aphidicola]|uniref:DNA mismatch repair endonuclease MutL n=1 Tax=Buchnera aphidicola TaxID=9 RepID=UPI0031B6FB71
MFIRKLSSKVINQIAVGEIIRGPASIVKELLENSLDAKADRIYIEIKKGGISSICVNDNGYGINKKELINSISSYSTSKIISINDLHNVNTFGFRGEALFNISLVSRLELISKTSIQKEGWKIYLDANKKSSFFMKPIAHLIGTTISIFDLFYNFPIRRNFIKKEKVEFSKIVKIVKLIALSQSNTTFILKHNKKLIKEYLVNNKKNIIEERVKSVLGEKFFKTLLKIEFRDKKNKLFGWIQNPIYKNINYDTKNRYLYVNKRFVDSRKITFLLKEIIKRITGHNYINISYVLYLQIPFNLVDVNYHPTKNEVLFNNSFKIYNFFYNAIVSFFKKQKNSFLSFLNLNKKKKTKEKFLCKENLKNKKNIGNKKFANYKNFCLFNFQKEKFKKKINFSFGKIIAFIKNYYVLIEKNEKFFLISLPNIQSIILKKKINHGNFYDFKKLYLISPKKIFFLIKIKNLIIDYKNLLFKLGFTYSVHLNFIQVQSVPKLLQESNLLNLIISFFLFLENKKNITDIKVINYFIWLIQLEVKNWGKEKMYRILQEIEKYNLIISNVSSKKFLQSININTAMSIFENEKKH